MKKLYFGSNLKMYKGIQQTEDYLKELVKLTSDISRDEIELFIIPSYTSLERVGKTIDQKYVKLGAQNMCWEEQGQFTGEISPTMLKDAGCAWVLTGHSERRHVIGESPELVGKKTAFALEQGLSVILCIGETLAQRRAGKLDSLLWLQLEKGLAGLGKDADFSRLAVAYEPVWAIGTGQTASNEDICMVHTLVRELLSSLLGSDGIGIRILYGGSVKPSNAKSILTIDNVNGLLVGGASLQAQSFADIVRADLA